MTKYYNITKLKNRRRELRKEAKLYCSGVLKEVRMKNSEIVRRAKGFR